eukprot:UN11802
MLRLLPNLGLVGSHDLMRTITNEDFRLEHLYQHPKKNSTFLQIQSSNCILKFYLQLCSSNSIFNLNLRVSFCL